MRSRFGVFSLVVAMAACADAQHDQRRSEPRGRLSALDRELSIGAMGDDVAAVQDYLANYGYFPNARLARTYPLWDPLVDSSAERAVYDTQTQAAVALLQGRAGLPRTGIVDEKTGQLLQSVRCGVPEGVATVDRRNKFALHASTWSKTSLTWSIGDAKPGLSEDQFASEVAAAFATWHAETNLAFVQTAADADIEISFAEIDGVGGTVASALFPDMGGDIVLDIAEAWSPEPPASADRLDLRAAILHEIGHALGIAHSTSVAAVMYPYYEDRGARRTLTSDDRVAISAIYDTWNQALAAGAFDVGVGANGDVWVAALFGAETEPQAAKWDGVDWDIAAGVRAVRVAVAPDGAPWIVDIDGLIFTHASAPSEGSWSQQPGCAIDIAVGADGSVWGAGCPSAPGGGKIYRRTEAGWDEASGALGGVRIAVGPAGVPWLVTDKDEIYRRTSASAFEGGWEQLPSAAQDIGVGPDGAAWTIGTIASAAGYKVYLWNDAPEPGSDSPAQLGEWITVSGGGTNISVGPDGPWATNEFGSVFRQSPLAAFFQ